MGQRSFPQLHQKHFKEESRCGVDERRNGSIDRAEHIGELSESPQQARSTPKLLQWSDSKRGESMSHTHPLPSSPLLSVFLPITLATPHPPPSVYSADVAQLRRS